MHTPPPDDPLEALVARCLRDAEEGDGTELARVCREHPEHAAAITLRVRTIHSMGLAGGIPAAEPSPPDGGGRPLRLGGFQLLHRIASGGMGAVYVARQEGLDRDVALKLVHPEHLYFPGARERFRREVEAVARLQHPGIIPIYTVGEDAGIPFFTMERIRGGTLADVLAAVRGRDPAHLSGHDMETAVRRLDQGSDDRASSSPSCSLYEGDWEHACLKIARAVAEAMQHAHERGVLHRDLKPSNIAITVDGQVKILDFGLAFSEGDQHITRTGGWVGSLPYLSPEQVRGERAAIGPHSDVYALGVTIYEALTLRPPFQSEDASALRARILEGRPTAPRRHNPRLSWEAETVCLAGMQPEPQRRYRSMQDYAEDLDHVLARRPIQARRPGVALRAQRWIQRHRATTVGLALVALALPTVLWLQQRNTNLQLRVRLLDALHIQALRTEADALYPAVPAMVPRMESWLARAEPIARELDQHLVTLEQLRSNAAPLVDAGETERWRAEIEELRQERTQAATSRSKWWRAIVARLDQQIDELQHRTTEVARYVADPESKLAIGTLEGLARERVAFRTLVEDVRARRALAVELHRRQLAEDAPVWQETRRAIRDHPAYGGMDIEPVTGLLPLGQDPRSGLFEFAHLASGKPAVRRNGQLAIDAETGIVLVLIPAGAFDMGCTRAAAERFEGRGIGGRLQESDEAPVHHVELAAFLLSKYEITQAQWGRISGTRPSAYPHPWIEDENIEVTPTNPVESVSWYECRDVLARVDLDLPTEAQWEYAARGGTSSLWWPGNTRDELSRARRNADETNSYLNVADIQFRNNGAVMPPGFSLHEAWLDDHQLVHAPVGSFPPNPFGLHEILGNVSEWCRDPLGDYRHAPQGPEGLFPLPLKTGRCYRGGSFMRTLAFCRSADRNQEWPGARMEDVGVRPMRRVRE